MPKNAADNTLTPVSPFSGNDATEKSVIKGQAASAQQFNRQEYNVLEDDISKPTASALIAEYSSSTQDQQSPVGSPKSQPQQYNEARPVLLVANQYDDTLYEQSKTHHALNNNNDASLRTRLTENPTRHEATNELAKPYASVSYREQQSVNQPIDQQHSFRLQAETRRPQEQLLLKIIPNGSPGNTGFLVPIPRPYPVEKIVEKTVHVPHPIEVEKVIEKKVQVPVVVPLPQPYPVHVHVPVDRLVEKQIRVPQLYPIHVERVVEKRVPYAVQRLVVQPPPSYPLHLRSPAAYPAQVRSPIERPAYATASSSFVEQPTQVTPIEKATEKPVAGSSRPIRPYRVDADRDSSVETRYKYQQTPHELIFAGENVEAGHGGEAASESQSNVSQFYADHYGRSSPFVYDHGLLDPGKYHVSAATHLPGNVRLMIVPKKFGAPQTLLLRPHVPAPSYTMLPVTFRRQIMYNLVEKDKLSTQNEYVGPLPPRKTFASQAKPLLPAKSSLYSTSVTQPPPATTAGGLRRTRQPEAQYTGSFRQSKMEYGFKPPMVPSVQYDEKTASKVDN